MSIRDKVTTLFAEPPLEDTILEYIVSIAESQNVEDIMDGKPLFVSHHLTFLPS